MPGAAAAERARSGPAVPALPAFARVPAKVRRAFAGARATLLVSRVPSAVRVLVERVRVAVAEVRRAFARARAALLVARAMQAVARVSAGGAVGVESAERPALVGARWVGPGQVPVAARGSQAASLRRLGVGPLGHRVSRAVLRRPVVERPGRCRRRGRPRAGAAIEERLVERWGPVTSRPGGVAAGPRGRSAAVSAPPRPRAVPWSRCPSRPGVVPWSRCPPRQRAVRWSRCPSRPGVVPWSRGPPRQRAVRWSRCPSRPGVVPWSRCPPRQRAVRWSRCPSRPGVVPWSRCPPRPRRRTEPACSPPARQWPPPARRGGASSPALSSHCSRSGWSTTRIH
jgi:hypothetical protein